MERKTERVVTEKYSIHSWKELSDITHNESNYFQENVKTKKKLEKKSTPNLDCGVNCKFLNRLNVRKSALDWHKESPLCGSTSSCSSFKDKAAVRRLSYTKQKMLGEFKKQNQKVFIKSNSNSCEPEAFRIDRNDPELRTFAAEVGIDIDDDDDIKKPNTIFRLDHLTPSYIEDPPVPNGNIYGGHYGFPSDFQLKEKYSIKTFDFLLNVVKDYAVFLKDHPSEDYPSISTLMVRSEQKLTKEESEKVRYYDEMYLRSHSKDCCDSSSFAFNSEEVQYEDCFDTINENKRDFGENSNIDFKLYEALKYSQSIRKKQNEEKCFGYYIPSSDSIPRGMEFTKYVFSGGNKTIRSGPLTQEEVNQARKTGMLNLSHRSLLEIPERIWSIDVVTQEDRKAYEESFEVPVHPSLWWTFKALISLNLSYNSLSAIYPQGSALVSLRELHINNNMLEELPDEIGNLQNLIFLDLDTNALKTLPLTFPRLKKLQELKLKRNFIERLPKTFGNLISLQKLDLSFNKMVKLPVSICDLEFLENINLSYNKLSSLPQKFNNLKNLEVVNVCNNKIIDLPLMQDMTKLVVINAACNAIHQFPDFAGCKTLTELRLDGNKIKKVITENLRDCPLIQLTMQNNKIEAIPDDIYQVSTLVLIDFSNNHLLWLPWSLARLKYLSLLNVDLNNISNVEQFVLEAGSQKIIDVLKEKLIRYEGDECITESNKNGEIYSHIEVLYEKYPNNILGEMKKKDKADMKTTRRLICKNMKLSDIPEKSDLLQQAKISKVFCVDLTKNNFNYVPSGLKMLIPYLTELILSENFLKTIPNFIGRMNLVYLDISFNYLDSLPLSLGSSSLKRLNVRNNCFLAVPKVIYSMQALEYLDFEGNQITRIDSDRLKNLRNLSYLNFNENSVGELPRGLVHLPKLKHLNVSNNQFKHPSSDVLKKGTEAILEYLSDIK